MHAPTQPASTLPTVNGSNPRATWRVWRAYHVTLTVLGSYLWLRFAKRYLSQASFNERLEAAHERNAKRIFAAIVALQGLYIKVGQLISIMTNFLPEAFRQGLQGLQDRVPPRPYEEIERRIRTEFNGQGPHDLFSEFQESPIASASIGQVHLARLSDGRRVAVKVQYPDIETIVQSDLRTLKRIFGLIERYLGHRGLDAVYREIREMVIQELDFTSEVSNGEAIAKHFCDRSNVKFPRVIHELTTRRILVTEFVDGVKANDLVGLSAKQIDPSQLARLVIETYCQQIFHHGIYHADPHPGNILVTEGPTINFIDFGAVAELSPNMRNGLVSFLQGAIKRDTGLIVSALKQMGFLAYKADPRIYDRVVEYFYDRLQREIKLDSFNLKDIKFDPQQSLENIADLRKMDISLADMTDTFHVPKEWIMLERTLLLLMGLCTALDPNLNPMEVIQPHVERLVLGTDGDWSKFMVDTGREMALSLIALPVEMKKLTTRALHGDLEVRVTSHDELGRIHYAIGHQFIFTALTIASGWSALHFFEHRHEQGFLGSLVVGGGSVLLLMRSMWIHRKWSNRRR